ncbi:acetate/propionate family kinase [Enhydrobacter sp.]|uniref:acetate/propionate family kinase n=1 Tax=Enhydrobacter sp. TaxID=1894999 RepID=UPI00260F0652|nr:acetate/propionate family kinase [Enhydrobacter sp.]WIM11507.1 MAG: Acetate kinase [Enhydrobacter sp.]
MQEPILVLNAGSSSLKFSVFETEADRSLRLDLHGQVESLGAKARLTAADTRGHSLVDRPVDGRDHDHAFAALHDWLAGHVGRESAFEGVGHRVVHGGAVFCRPVAIDDAVIGRLEKLVPLAPLHQPHNLAAIRAVRAVAPEVPQVACFDTAFHATQPAVAARFALPRALIDKGVRRYGFHGLSYEYIASALPAVAPECAAGKVVVAHLGNGASMCAIDKGRSVATTMGLTALDGLPMGTRCGTLDPGALLYVMRSEGLGVAAAERLLYDHSGLLGVSGLSSDMRTLLASDRPGAREAVDLFVYRIGRELGSLAATVGGLDALVFTGGIGENAAPIRARVCNDARWLGIALDEEANAAGGPRISTAASRVSAWAIPTDENLMIARHTRRVIDGHPPP